MPQRRPVEAKSTMRLAFENASINFETAPPELIQKCVKALKRGVGVKQQRSMWSVIRRGSRR